MTTIGMERLLDAEDKDNYALWGQSGFRGILNKIGEIAEIAETAKDKGSLFEKLVKAFIQQDKARRERFSDVWLWSEWPGRRNRPDTGIDLVAREKDSGNLVAIQCKYRKPGTTLYLDDIATFLAALGRNEFSEGIVVSTTDNWGPNVENSLKGRDKPVSRWGAWHFDNSTIDWTNFTLDSPEYLVRQTDKTLRPHQVDALNDVLDGFENGGRGKLIMPCGSGKTFTALRVAERLAGAGGAVLFLTPSISLLSQSMNDWCNDSELPIRPIAVCSDNTAGARRSQDSSEIGIYDLAESPTTDPETLFTRFSQTKGRDGKMVAVFSTYQSLGVVAEAQKLGLPEFDLIVSDEAHRTTGVRSRELSGNADESGFSRVHDNGFVRSRRRLYMTATPRIYKDQAKRSANEKLLTLTSMDDESIYGPEFHRLGFGKAVDDGILSDYKVVILEVDMEEVGVTLERMLSDSSVAETTVRRAGQARPSSITLSLDNASRMVGCWNGLRKMGVAPDEFREDPDMSRRAVAFTNTVNQSLEFAHYFPQVVEEVEKVRDPHLSCEVEHVDGAMNMQIRATALGWLRDDGSDDLCKVLSNARCLTEGVDVPALDAILFLYPRSSTIDVVQAVGRAMRRSEGKNYGYVILPVAREPGKTSEETLNDSRYRFIWQVLNALKSHDDRFEAEINQIALTRKSDDIPFPKGSGLGVSGEGDGGNGELGGGGPGEEEVQMRLRISGGAEFRDAILAKVVDKYADPAFWAKWAEAIRQIALAHESRIRALLRGGDGSVRSTFDDYLAGLRDNLNDGVSEDEAIGMLSQHLVTKPVFDAVFGDFDFVNQNPVSKSMQATIDALDNRGLERETRDLDAFYRDVRTRVRGLHDPEAKQRVVKELYENFIQLALPDTARSLGVVYTPIELVDWIIRSVEDVLKSEFGASVSDEGVHVLDPFTGTGTFITRLIQSGLIRPEDMERKYRHELHANELLLLAYYIAAINIETAYHGAVGIEDTVDYRPFEGIVLTDTFEQSENAPPMDSAMFPSNNKRAERQKGLDIRVIMGNPPWSRVGNRAYPMIDERVQETYAKASTANNLNALFDPYVKAIRSASDRVQEFDKGGVVAFVTNGGFIDSKSFDGFRKLLPDGFDTIYCYNLRGKVGDNGGGGNVFPIRIGVAILILVKKSRSDSAATAQRQRSDSAATAQRQRSDSAATAQRQRSDRSPIYSTEILATCYPASKSSIFWTAILWRAWNGNPSRQTSMATG